MGEITIGGKNYKAEEYIENQIRPQEGSCQITNFQNLDLADDDVKASSSKKEKVKKIIKKPKLKAEICVENSKSLFKIGYLKLNNEIIISDKEDSSLKICNSNTGKYCYTVFEKVSMENPYALCVSSLNKIFVTEFYGESFNEFDSKFTFQRNCKLTNSERTKIECILVDDKYMYGALFHSNRIKRWTIADGIFVDQSIDEIIAPAFMALNQDKLYVASSTKFELKENSNQLNKITSGSNCIFILNKMDLKLLKTLVIDNWLGPAGIFIDNSKIITTAYSLTNEEKIVSKNRFLFIIKDQEKLEIEKLELENVGTCNSIGIFDNKVLVTYKNSIKLINF